ncbi:MAG: GNAT family N-acetyltransferase [Yoonia sp.]|jgi:GNAT superfamily N-acetyltransferase|nr:GNAT family N-acetyltransferase [Yoonia sp.]
MTTAINLGGPADDERLLSLMGRYHEELGLDYDDVHRAKVAAPLLEGSPLGAVWLIGPQRAPLGYVLVTFGWSVRLGGMIGWVEEVFIRPSVRSRGIGTEVLHAVAVSLGQAGIRALQVRVDDDARLASFCKRVGFNQSADQRIMTDVLS